MSFCSAVSDDGVAAVAEKCTNLEYLNVAGLHRVTDSAARHVTHNLWKLRTLNLEDLHLVTDAIFHFDAVRDGRIAASQNMLSHLAELRAAWKSTTGSPPNFKILELGHVEVDSADVDESIALVEFSKHGKRIPHRNRRIRSR
jgi:hypothetical protein